MGNVRTHYFFREERRFPWEWYGGVPKIGQTHSYICAILARYSENDQSHFFLARPSYRELIRFSSLNGGLARLIVQYCDQVYAKPLSDRKNVAHEVLNFLSGFEPFRKDFQERVDYLYSTGRISVPKECAPYE